MADNNFELTLKRYQMDAEDDLELTHMNLHERALQSPGLKAKWLATFLGERKVLSTMKNQKESLVQSYIDANYRQGCIIQTLRAKAERNESIGKITQAILQQQDIVDYLQGITDFFKGLDFSIKNAVDLRKLEN